MASDEKELSPVQRFMVNCLCPHVRVEAVTDLDPDALWQRGIRGVVLDLDNTIIPWKGREHASDVSDWLARLTERGLRVTILSNAGNPWRVKRVADAVGVQYVGRAMKPLAIAFRRALKQLDLPADQVAMIGDQVFTDVLGGRRAGLMTILVRPIAPRDFVTTRVQRFFERRVLAWLEANGYLVTGMGKEN